MSADSIDNVDNSARSVGKLIGRIRAAAVAAADRMGPDQGLDEKVRDASDYWTSREGGHWESNSHWRSGLGDQTWREVGEEHLSILRMFATALGGSAADFGTVVDWGCGGGAVAAALAPLSNRMLIADVVPETLAECEAQIRSGSDTPLDKLEVNLANPEKAAAPYANQCDTFICIYVIELTADPAEALRIVRIATQMLKSGGMAVFQVKYRANARFVGPVKRAYRRNLANMTVFSIDEFWSELEKNGLTPKLITLVPRTRLDRNYAYFAAVKP
ncbi:methyltransferase [Gordonia rhizosphera]|uniref:Putative methyltransferase n=1 Tax=Gordonia rhizosphera NBRC 16068 TaxID=1108045 RepID=K6VQB4_9ACTN|nr:methyltransferase [Gordonia rhizosphera]GAB89110.1 putative methyltransferase [Gordonia rhizosphera NBRC 16068]